MSKKPIVLETCLAISMEARQWGGRRTLSAQDLGSGVNIPPKTVANLGSKKICDHSLLRIFNTLKTRANSYLEKVGVGQVVKGAYVIPREKAREAVAYMEDIKRQYESEKQKFLANYDSALEDWLDENREWADILRGSLLSRKEVEGKISFDWSLFSFGPSGDPDLDAGLDRKVKSFTDQLLEEVAAVAADSWEKSFNGREKVTKKSLGKLKEIREKMSGFALAQPFVVPIVQEIDGVLNSITCDGPIVGTDLTLLRGLMCTLKDTATLKDFAERSLEGQGTVSTMDYYEEGVSVSEEETKTPELELSLPMEEPAAQPEFVAADSVPSASAESSTEGAMQEPPCTDAIPLPAGNLLALPPALSSESPVVEEEEELEAEEAMIPEFVEDEPEGVAAAASEQLEEENFDLPSYDGEEENFGKDPLEFDAEGHIVGSEELFPGMDDEIFRPTGLFDSTEEFDPQGDFLAGLESFEEDDFQPSEDMAGIEFDLSEIEFNADFA